MKLLTDLLSLSFRCSNTFAKVEGIADVIWKTQRYHLVREYASHPVLPPPLIVVEHAFRLILAIVHKLKNQKKNAKQSGKSPNRTFSESDCSIFARVCFGKHKENRTGSASKN